MNGILNQKKLFSKQVRIVLKLLWTSWVYTADLIFHQYINFEILPLRLSKYKYKPRTRKCDS